MTSFDLGRLQVLLDSVRESRRQLEERREELKTAAPCGLTTGDYAELLGMARSGLEFAEEWLERMTKTKETQP